MAGESRERRATPMCGGARRHGRSPPRAGAEGRGSGRGAFGRPQRPRGSAGGGAARKTAAAVDRGGRGAPRSRGRDDRGRQRPRAPCVLSPGPYADRRDGRARRLAGCFAAVGQAVGSAGRQEPAAVGARVRAQGRQAGGLHGPHRASRPKAGRPPCRSSCMCGTSPCRTETTSKPAGECRRGPSSATTI